MSYLNHCDNNITPLCINLPKLKGSLKSLKNQVYVMYSLRKRNDKFKKCGLWNKLKEVIGRDSNVEIVHDDKYITAAKRFP